MADIVSLLLPFFGLIIIGFIAAKVTKQPAEAMGWLNTFIIYAACLRSISSSCRGRRSRI